MGQSRIKLRSFRATPPPQTPPATIGSVKLNIPNLLTYLRIAAIPFVIGVYYLPGDWLTLHEKNLWATWTCALAAVTDWVDGWLARKLNQTSAFGAFLDPVADKLMVAAVLAILLQMERVDAVIAFIIIGREIAISALREWMAQLGATKSVAVNMAGKVKTVAQMVALPMLLYHNKLHGFDAHYWGTILLYGAAFLTLYSMFFYLKAAWPTLMAKSP